MQTSGSSKLCWSAATLALRPARRCLLPALLLVWLVPFRPASAAVTLNAVTNSTGIWYTGIPSDTFSHSTAGADRLLLVIVATYSTAHSLITDVTYSGVGLTRAGYSATSNGQDRAELWFLVNPPSGAHSVVITLPASNPDGVAAAVSFTGVDQTSPLGSISTAIGNAASASIAVSSAAGELVIDGIVTDQSGGQVLTAAAGQTLRGSFFPGDEQLGTSTTPGTPSVTTAWTISNSQPWSMLGVSIRPSAVQGDGGLDAGGDAGSSDAGGGVDAGSPDAGDDGGLDAGGGTDAGDDGGFDDGGGFDSGFDGGLDAGSGSALSDDGGRDAGLDGPADGGGARASGADYRVGCNCASPGGPWWLVGLGLTPWTARRRPRRMPAGAAPGFPPP